MARRNNQELAFAALSIKGALLAPDFLNKVAHLDATEQSEADYDIPRGLRLRDEIGRYWKIAQNLWLDFSSKRERSDVDSHAVTERDFLEPLCRQVLGFADIREVGQVTIDERIFPIGFAASDSRVPLVFAAHNQGLDKSSVRHGDGMARRSPFLLAQEYLNATSNCLWALVSNGLKLRILRDNSSLTRPAYIEADLEAIFNEGLYADFSALWLLAHGSRFGKAGAEPADCALERWRNTAQEDGIRARDRLRVGVTEALRALGTGFLAHDNNAELRHRIEIGELSTRAYFEQLLRLIYRFIFLATIEDRELVFAPNTVPEARERYLSGYSLSRLRRLAARRRNYDRYADLWQVLIITFRGLGSGQPALGLPALGGLFDSSHCPDLDAAGLDNQALLSALFSLCFFRDGAALSRVNYRDMDSEELGSVYESLLELVPQIRLTAGIRKFGFVGDEEEGNTKGNARKLTGSYYTPDSLVQELIKSALEPVIRQTLTASPREPLKALLGLTVCDPACGSGHFLLAAARRIADEVALLRAQEGSPTEDDFRHALRDVVAHCIYGVDKNPMAVELARTALWLEAYTPDLPLTFLDAHLRCGDALLGVLDESILQDGIPDKAFNAHSGDDKEVVKLIKKSNRDAVKAIIKAQEKSRHMLSLELGDDVDAAAFEALPDDTLEALQAKQAAHLALEANIAASKARLAADILVAAFVYPKTAETAAYVPTSQDLWLVLNGDCPRPGIAASAHDAAQAMQAFHWWQAFPQVKAKGGFDVLLGNPPWEVSQMGEEEYFAARAPSIAALAGEKRKRAILGLETEDPKLWREYIADSQRIEATNSYIRESGRFPLTAVGKLNTYPLFAETFSQLVREQGRAGFIVPTGIATDDTTKAYFSGMTQAGRLASLYDIENRDAVFPSVHRSYKFCLLTLGQAKAAEFVCFAAQTIQLDDRRRRFTLTPEEFRLINPNTLTCPIFRSERDATLTKKLYRAAPVMIEEGPPENNPWAIKFAQGLFNMTSDSGLFRDVPGVGRVPLYEAKMIHQFDHRWATYSVNGSGDVSITQKQDPKFSVTPRYWVEADEVEARLHELGWDSKWLIGWRRNCRSTDERTCIANILPPSAVGDSLFLMLPGVESAALHAALLSNLNSLVFDFISRQKVGGVNFSFYFMKQLPVLPPTRYTETDLAFIVPRILELTYTANDLKAWAEDLGYHGPAFPWNPERRAQLRAELDVYYARLYGLSRDEFRYILDPADIEGEDYPSETFRVLKNNEMRDFGEYRTQRLVLETWDRLEAEQLDERSNTVVLSDHGLIRNNDSADFAGIVFQVIKQYPDGIATSDLQALIAYGLQPTIVSQYVDLKTAERLTELMSKICRINVVDVVQLVPDVLHRLQSAGVCRSRKAGDTVVYVASGGDIPTDVFDTPEHSELGSLLFGLDMKRKSKAETESIVRRVSDGHKGAA
jgi:hypothetical protein